MPECKPRSLTVRVVESGPAQKPVETFDPVFRTPDHPTATKLRHMYHLLEVAGQGSDFERARRIKTWVRQRWDHGYDGRKMRGELDALALLAAAKRGLNFACGSYAQTFMECCQAVGLPARRLNIRRKETDFPHGCRGNNGHCVAEVYCRELGKWVLMDADRNSHYCLRGKPMSALDLHRSWRRDRGKGAVFVEDDPAIVAPASCPGYTPLELRRMTADCRRHHGKHFFHYIVTSLVHGFAQREAKRFPSRRLFFAGEGHPWLARNFRGNIPLDGWTLVDREDQFNWPIDRTFLQARMLGQRPSRLVEIRLQHTMPYFHHFELAVGRAAFRRLRGDGKRLRLSEGRTTLRARCVDVYGRPGHEARMRIAVCSGPLARVEDSPSD